MLFGIGTKVKFLHTGDEGVVRNLLGDGIVEVYVEADDMVIPTFEGDIIRHEDWEREQKIKAKFVQGKKEKKPIPPERRPPETQYQIIKSLGIQLAFDPIYTSDGRTEKYEIFLINDLKQAIIFEIVFLLNGEKEDSWSGTLDTISTEFLGNLFYDELNDSPTFEIKVTPITTKGTGKTLRKTLKIKAKQFFNNTRTAPLLNKKVHWYSVFESLKPLNSPTKENLKSYTKANTKKRKSPSNLFRNINLDSIQEYAEFVPELDLHIEKLIKKSRKMSNAEIVRIQMAHFEEFLNQAIQLGVSPVFVIHGVGKGKLKDMIASKLMQHPDVQTFKNEYHHKYGWGATEIIL